MEGRQRLWDKEFMLTSSFQEGGDPTSSPEWLCWRMEHSKDCTDGAEPHGEPSEQSLGHSSVGSETRKSFARDGSEDQITGVSHWEAKGEGILGRDFGCLFHFASEHPLCYTSRLIVFRVRAPSK